MHGLWRTLVNIETPQKLQEKFQERGPWQTRFQMQGRTYGGAFHVPDENPLQRQFLEFCALPQRVLELGCMEGGRTFPLARCCGNVIAVDGRREHLQRARWMADQLRIGNVSFLEMDLEAADLQTLGHVDVVYNVGLLYLLQEPWRLLRQLAEISPAMLLLTHLADPDQERVTRCGYRGALTTEHPGDPIGGLRSQAFRPADRWELERMLEETGWTEHSLFREEGTALGYWCQERSEHPSRNQVACRQTSLRSGTVSVIVVCHNYAHYLEDCLKSLFAQTRCPDEILLVDDASTDHPESRLERYRLLGVNLLRVDHNDPRLARKAGLEATTGEVVCFLDADDLLTPDYLRSGLEQLRQQYDVGIVYSDMLLFGTEENVTTFPEEVDSCQLSRKSQIHSAALVRREALLMSQALEVPADARRCHEDWLCWRKVLQSGWRAIKQPALYHYRRHDDSASHKQIESDPYYHLRGLEHETITLFVPLSGRSGVWPRFQQFLEQQSWPHDQVQLVLMETSQNARFERRIRRWITKCDYRDIRSWSESVGEPGLADQNRREAAVGDAVRLAAARIYNRMSRDLSGDFVWIVEDDVIPPNNAAEMLLRGFDEKTASVAGPYRSRFHEGYVAWTEGRELIKERGQGVDIIEGNGFGCTMFRAEVLQKALFTCRQPPYRDFDPAFYDRLKSSGLQAKLNWKAESEHLETDPRTIMVWDHWPEAWETMEMTDYRSGFLSGRAACEWIVERLNGPEPAAIWGLSDGDVAWWCYDALKKIPGVDQNWLKKLVHTSGLHSEDRDELWPFFDEACRNSPHWLVQHNWDIAERFTHSALEAQGVEIDREGFGYVGEMKTKIDCNAVYRLINENLWWPLLDRKRLAIISGHADEFTSRLIDNEFVKARGEIGVTWSIECKFNCPTISVPKAGYWNRLRDELFESEWDLLLCSAGSLSAIICEAARQQGRNAIDIGALDATILKKNTLS